jgi:hypothetical protein
MEVDRGYCQTKSRSTKEYQESSRKRQAQANHCSSSEVDSNGAGKASCQSGQSHRRHRRKTRLEMASESQGGAEVESDMSYEIFKREADHSTVLIEAVKGIEEAQKRVEELNRGAPDQYFILDPLQAKVVDPADPTAEKDPLAP